MNDNEKFEWQSPKFTVDARLFLIGVALVLVTLKLTGHVLWPWWLVLAPLWVWFAFWVFVLVLGAVLIKASRLFKGEKK